MRMPVFFSLGSRLFSLLEKMINFIAVIYISSEMKKYELLLWQLI